MTSSPPPVALVITSHRGIRAGPSVGALVETVLEPAAKDGNVNLKTVDVKTFNLPVFSESLISKDMAMQGIEYEIEVPRAWAKEMASHDGYIFLVNEYNFGVSGATKNALGYSWAGFAGTEKPMMIVSHGPFGVPRWDLDLFLAKYGDHQVANNAGDKASEQISVVLGLMELQVVDSKVKLPRGTGPDGFSAALEDEIGNETKEKWLSTKSVDILAAFEELQKKIKEETPVVKRVQYKLPRIVLPK